MRDAEFEREMQTWLDQHQQQSVDRSERSTPNRKQGEETMTNPSPLGSLEHIAPPPHAAPRLTPAEYLRKTEQTLAYERASGVIEAHCMFAGENVLEDWWDLDSSEESLADEVAYLDARRLLIHHPEHPRWVQLCDEDEPLPEQYHAARAAHALSADEPQQNCAKDMVRRKYPQTRVVRSTFGLVVQDDESGKTLGAGRAPAYWHEEAWMNAIEEVEGR